MATKNSNQNLIAALIVALLALTGLNIYQYINRNSLISANKQQEEELIALDKAKTDLDKEYYEALSDLEEMKSSNAELNQIIDGQKEELTKQKNRISALLKDSKNLKTAKEEIAKLSQQAEQYLAEITVLREENEKLNADNSALREQNTSLTTRVDVQQRQNQKLDSLKNVLSDRNEDLTSKNSQLTKKVDQASTIEVDDIDVKGYQLRDSGKERRKRSADNVEFLRVCFTTLPNELASSGPEDFFIRIIDPIGETVTMESKGSGIIKVGLDNQPIRYSISVQADYSGTEAEKCVDWKPGGKFKEGRYQVEVYNKGFLAGTGEFRLR